MGQKVSPTILRIGINKTWTSRWFAPSKSMFREYISEDRKIRGFMFKELEAAAVAKVDIERSPEWIRVIVHTARPGVLIGRRGENIQRLQESVQKIIGTIKQLKMDYVEIQKPEIDAQLIAGSISFQLEKRVAYRRAMKRAIQQAMEGGAKGIRIISNGRLGGSEMKRTEGYRDGKVPLGTLRSDIDFGTATAHTTAGCIGIKVWVYKGDVVRLRSAASLEARPISRPQYTPSSPVAPAASAGAAPSTAQGK